MGTLLTKLNYVFVILLIALEIADVVTPSLAGSVLIITFYSVVFELQRLKVVKQFPWCNKKKLFGGARIPHQMFTSPFMQYEKCKAQIQP